MRFKASIAAAAVLLLTFAVATPAHATDRKDGSATCTAFYGKSSGNITGSGSHNHSAAGAWSWLSVGSGFRTYSALQGSPVSMNIQATGSVLSASWGCGPL